MIVDDKNIGQRLEFLIKKMGYTRKIDFLSTSGIKKGTLYTIIKNNRRPTAKTRAKLEAMGINVDWLLTGEGEPLLAREDESKSATGVRFEKSEGATPPAAENMQVRDAAQGERMVYSSELSSYKMQPPGFVRQGGDEVVAFIRILNRLDTKELELVGKLIAAEIEERKKKI